MGRVAFSPKSYSHARNFREKKGKSGNDKDFSSTVDDDGIVIFWKKDTFKPIELGFLKFPNEEKSEAVVAVVLQHIKSKKTINVLSTHLPSGDEAKKEVERLDVLKSAKKETWTAKKIVGGDKKWDESTYTGSSFDGIVSFVKHYVDRKDNSTTIFALDANSRPAFPVVSQTEKGEKTNAWNTILKGIPALESVWVQNKLLNVDGKSVSTVTFPVSVNKMRGPSSDQPAKIGEHQCELIDQVFTTSKKSKLVQEELTAPNNYAGKEGKAELELYPTTKMPSDHLPVLVDITV